MRHIKIFLKTRVLVVLLALASPYAAVGAELNMGAQPAPANGVRFSKILNHQTANGSDIILQANQPANPGVYGLTRLATNVTGALAPQGLAVQNSLQVNNTAPTAAAGGPAFVSPLYDNCPQVATMVGDYVAVVPSADVANLFLVPTTSPASLVTTAHGALTAGTAVLPPTIAFNPARDAAGNPTGQVAALAAAGATSLFAAVGANGSAFTDPADDRGIAKFTVKNNVLEQAKLNPATPADANATPLSLGAVRADGGAPADVGAVLAADNLANPNVIQAGAFGAPGGIGAVVHYDKDLDRVFVGLKGLRKDAAARAGGLVGVLVGQPNGAAGALDLRSIFHAPTRGLLDAGGAEENRHDRVLGIFKSAAGGAAVVRDKRLAPGDNSFVSIHQLKTMHTSTGRSYLIVASEVGGLTAANAIAGPGANPRLSSGLYFVPIMGNKAFDVPKTPAAFDQIGKVANAGGTAILSGGAGVAAVPGVSVQELAAAGSLAALPLAGLNCITNTVEILDDARSRVRTVPLFAASRGVQSTYISDLQVLGDSVLVSVASTAPAGRTNFKGVYQSTAIFDADGKIVSWTPLQRMSGVADSTRAVAIDNVTGAVMSLNQDGNTFHLADWVQNRPATIELQGLIAKHFPASQGGVRAIHTFDGSTPTFRGGLLPAAQVRQQQQNLCSLLVVLGYDKVMVVQTAFNNRIARHYRDTAAWTVAPAHNVGTFGGVAAFGGVVNANDIQNVFVFDNQGLKDIAPLTCAEVLKVVRNGANSTEGNIYIGGYNGVCRLEPAVGAIPLTGAGWELRNAAGAVGLRNFGDEVVTAGLTFKKLANPALKDVRRIVSTIGTAAAALDLAGSRVVAVLGDGYMVARGDQLGFPAAVAKVAVADSGPIFDGVLVKNIAAPIPPAPPALYVPAPHAAADQSRLILATEKGLVVRDLAGANPDQTVPLAGGDLPIQLAYMPRSRGGVTGGGAAALNGAGMLYVLAGSQAGGDIRVHRYAVIFDGANPVLLLIGDVKPMDVHTFRRYFATDGLQFLFGNDMALDTPEMLNQMLLSSAGAAPYSLTYAMKGAGLGAFTNAAVRESVTGAWMVPGSFGLVAND